MKHLNKILKMIFVVMATLFIYLMLTTPKTDCQACKLPYGDKTIDGYEAFEVVQKACFAQIKPWNQPVYVDLDKINVTQIKGVSNITWSPEDELTREEVDNLTN